ncbi:hypothetical protein N9B10_05815 [Pirellulales bacterium]|jgi:hypothetical protein|nr:hypothetical protein [Pirellulales bacterium]MDA7889377.1 hypothetical protein [Pirellulales bacterium]
MDPHYAEAVAAIAATFDFYGEVDCLKKRKAFSKNSLKRGTRMYIQEDADNQISQIIIPNCHPGLELQGADT